MSANTAAAVRRWGFLYRASNGVPRLAVLLLPPQYGPRNPTPALPLVISPHGRGSVRRTADHVTVDVQPGMTSTSIGKYCGPRP